MGNSILQRSVLVYVFFFLATAQFAQSSKEAEIRKIEEMERMAIQNQDTVAMDKIWSKDLSVNSTGNNVVGKEEGMFALKNGFIHYSTYQKEAEKISMFGNLGIAMGLETVTPIGKAPKAGKTVKRRHTNIWMQKDGVWQLVARQATNIKVE